MLRRFRCAWKRYGMTIVWRCEMAVKIPFRNCVDNDWPGDHLHHPGLGRFPLGMFFLHASKTGAHLVTCKSNRCNLPQRQAATSRTMGLVAFLFSYLTDDQFNISRHPLVCFTDDVSGQGFNICYATGKKLVQLRQNRGAIKSFRYDGLDVRRTAGHPHGHGNGVFSRPRKEHEECQPPT